MLRTTSNRQMRLWMVYLDLEYDQPSRSDYYLMQIACEVRRVLSKNPKDITLDKFKLPFSKPEAVKMTPQRIEEEKFKWISWVGAEVPTETSSDGE